MSELTENVEVELNETPEQIKQEISEYDRDEIEKYIESVREELKKLDITNEDLESSNSNHHIRYVESFMRIYQETIVEQAKDMEELSTQIKEYMLTKDYLHSKHDEFSELLKSEQFMNLIRKIRRIKAIKQEMYRFLEQRGIRPPSN